MRAATISGIVLAILTGAALPASAGEGFDIVIPGRPGVPIIINGVDASYAVVEGDWGLAKGVHVQPTVYGGRYVDGSRTSAIIIQASVTSPATAASKSSRRPTAFCRSRPKAFINPGPRHSTPPKAQPAQPEVPFYPPPVIVAPPNGGGGMPHDPAVRPQDPRLRQPR